MNEILGPRFEQAISYAALLHADQRRKGGDIPYLAHLIAVAGLVIEDGAAAGELREDEVIAALLHDSAEDRGGAPRLADIEARFGPRVAEIVRACSDSLEPHGDKGPWRARKEAYLAHLAEEDDRGVLRVSLADKVHNSRAVLQDYRRVGEDLWGRFHRDADTPWYYRRLAEIFNDRMPDSALTHELERAVSELEEAIAVAPRLTSVSPARRGGAPARSRPRSPRRSIAGDHLDLLGGRKAGPVAPRRPAQQAAAGHDVRLDVDGHHHAARAGSGRVSV